MIVFRYFTKEVLNTLLAVTAVLLLVFLSNQIIRWLNEAASGDIASSVLMHLVLLELPYLLGLLLPLGLFLGILISYGRLYAENEMTVLFSSGMSRWQLSNITLSIATIVFVVVAILVMWINPLIAGQQNKLLTESSNNIIGTLVPGHFQTMQSDNQVIYVDSLSDDKQTAKNVFMAQLPTGKSNSKQWIVLSAQRGKQAKGPDGKSTFIVAEDGYRFQGVPGQKDYQITKYKEYGTKTPDVNDSKNDIEEAALPTLTLLANRQSNLDYFSELQWRISLPVSVYVLALLGMVLSKVKPRSGRFKQLVPAILLYIVYVNFIFVGREWLEDGVSPVALGLWWVHGVMLLIVGITSWWQTGRAKT